jgi:hypothetical protein
MSIASISLSADQHTQVRRILKKMSASRVFTMASIVGNPEPAFAIGIQLATLKQLQHKYFGKKEGIRLLLKNDRDIIIAALDLKLKDGKLHFSRLFTGALLETLLLSLNKLERKYRHVPGRWRVQIINFLLSTDTYLQVGSGESSVFYRNRAGKLSPVSAESIRLHIEQTLTSRINIHQA